MTRNYTVYFKDILECIAIIREYTQRMNFETLSKNQMTQDAVLRRIMIIGEAAAQIPKEIKKKYSEIPWQKIAGMRNIVIHVYDTINLKEVWDVITNDLDPLEKQIRQILGSLS